MKKLAAAVTFMVVSNSVFADLFSVDISAVGQSYSFSFNSAEEAIDTVDLEDVQKRILASGAFFDKDSSAAMIALAYRGLPMSMAFADRSTSLTFSVPGLGINETFTGADRDESVEMLKDYLKKNGGSVLTRINNTLAATTPFDPVAGNPDSLMASMVNTAAASAVSAISAVDRQSTTNTLGAELRFGQYSVAGEDVESYSLPLSYTVKFDHAPGHRLQFRMPLAYSQTNGEANTYSAAFGVAYTFPLMDGLEITPGIDYGAIVSEEMFSAGVLRSISLTTRYDFKLLEQDMTFANSLLQIDSEAVKVSEYDIDSALSNQVMSNTLVWRGEMGGGIKLQAFVRDTRYFGDQLYSEVTDEIGIAIGHRSVNSMVNREMYAGLSYLTTDRSEIDGIRFNMGVTF